MSKMSEYIDAACGYDSSGMPASTTQFTFGFIPFAMAENENIEDVTSITTVCNSDAIVDIQIIDSMVKIVFDFSMDVQTLGELASEIEAYNEQKTHVTKAVNEMMNNLYKAEREEDYKTAEDISMQLRSMDIPFMLPTILPVDFGGTVKVGFMEDPKFILFTSSHVNEQPYQITMIFDLSTLFIEDDVMIYHEDDLESEIAAQQEEMWYMDEARRAEEEAYQAQFGQYSDMYSSLESPQEEQNKKLKGVRIS